MSRRRLFAGAAAVASAGAMGSGVAGGTAGAAGAPLLRAPDLTAFTPQSGALSYMPLDGRAFFPETDNVLRYDGISGVGLQTVPGRLITNLPLPVGSVIREIAVAYQGQPIIEIFRRGATIDPPAQLVSTTLTAGSGPQTQTLQLNQSAGLLQPITVAFGLTYTLRVYVGAGDSIYGVTVGYTPPTQTFLPFSGLEPRILDTRLNNGLKLQPGEERTVALGFPGVRAAVINLAITETEGVGGFVSVFPADIAWPGNASINWSAANQNISNGVIAAVDSGAQIKIRAGAAATHVVIDRIGWFL